jgi:hypothetical protein
MRWAFIPKAKNLLELVDKEQQVSVRRKRRFTQDFGEAKRPAAQGRCDENCVTFQSRFLIFLGNVGKKGRTLRADRPGADERSCQLEDRAAARPHLGDTPARSRILSGEFSTILMIEVFELRNQAGTDKGRFSAAGSADHHNETIPLKLRPELCGMQLAAKEEIRFGFGERPQTRIWRAMAPIVFHSVSLLSLGHKLKKLADFLRVETRLTIDRLGFQVPKLQRWFIGRRPEQDGRRVSVWTAP